MLRVSPFYDHYTIRIRASFHNNTTPPIKLNKLSCSNMNLILLKHSCLIGQLNVPKLVSKMHVRRSSVYLCVCGLVGTVGEVNFAYAGVYRETLSELKPQCIP